MANVKNSNTFYIDNTATDLDEINVYIYLISVTPQGGAGRLELSDVNGDKKIDIATPTDETVIIDMRDRPMIFPNGVSPTTVTNCTATLLITKTGG